MVKAVDSVPRGHLRIQTGFLYPDGSSVDVFVVDHPDAPLLPPTELSDFGQTMAFLLDHDVHPWKSKKRKQQLEQAIDLYGVSLKGGSLVRPLGNELSSLQEGILLLGQACVRMSDLVYTKRLQLQSPFNDDVEEFFADAGLEYESGVQLDGAYGPVHVDFVVTGQRTRSAVLTLFSRISSSGHAQANEVFRRWHDLQAAGAPESRVTLLDDTIDTKAVYGDDDLRRIEQYSTIQPFSERSNLQTLLAA